MPVRKPALQQPHMGGTMVDLPPPGFIALDPSRPVHIYNRRLPHWRQEGATYFVTFRLADSLPQAFLDQLADERDARNARQPAPANEQSKKFAREQLQCIEHQLDKGHGACVLNESGPRDIVDRALKHFHEARYYLGCFAVLPNLVHTVIRPLGDHTLEAILESWKGLTAREINTTTQSSGPLWESEYFDIIIRDTPHLRRVVRYTERNPEKQGAGSVLAESRLGILVQRLRDTGGTPALVRCGAR